VLQVFRATFLISHHIVEPRAQIPAITISATIIAASADRARIPKSRRPTFFKGPGFGRG
jgi:hypothetical protein